MVKYQGSKRKYAARIEQIILQTGERFKLPLWDVCCGSGEFTAHVGPTHMVDSGPWGFYWRVIREHRDEFREHISEWDASISEYDLWVRSLEGARIPDDPLEWALQFIALQRESFNGKPIEIAGRRWKTPGLGRTTVRSKFLEAARRSLDVKAISVHEVDANTLTVSGPANIYLDPDYADTVGYGSRSVDIKSFVRRNRHCNLFVSHHTPLTEVEWDTIRDITVSGNARVNFAKDQTELVHVLRRTR